AAAVPLPLAPDWPAEQALTASTVKTSATSILGMAEFAVRGMRWMNAGDASTPGHRGHVACCTDQNVSHQQPPDWLIPKSRVLPSPPPVETRKPISGGGVAALAATAGVSIAYGGSVPAPASGGPVAETSAIPASGCLSQSA